MAAIFLNQFSKFEALEIAEIHTLRLSPLSQHQSDLQMSSKLCGQLCKLVTLKQGNIIVQQDNTN